jgi:predicted MPP superfamily phosphohydrolase
MKRGRGHRVRNTILLILPIVIAAVWVLNITVSRRVQLEEMRLTVLNLPDDLESYSILHLSDLHGARYGAKQKAFATELGTTRYSCVVMTGDMLGRDGDVEPLLELIALMPPDTPKFLIPGDTDGPLVESKAHSSLSVYTDWAERLAAAGIQILDKPVLITREKGRIWFIPEELYALDLAGTRNVFRKQVEDLNSRSAKLTADDAAMIRALEYEIERIDAMLEIRKEFLSTDMQVVLTHTPLSEEYLEDLISWTSKEEPFSIRYARLILAGHYNGGQWRIPFVGAVYVPELGWFPEDEEVRGLSYLQGIPQYISPGLGSDPHYRNMPGRIFNPPTVSLITLSRKAFK